MLTRLQPLLRTLSGLAVLIASTSALAADVKVDPKAQQVLDAFGKYISGLKGFEFTANVSLTVEQQGQRQSNEFVQTFAAARPNKLNYRLDSPQGGATIVSNGTDMSLYIKGLEKYSTEPAPATWGEMVQNQLVLGLISPGNAAVVTGAMLSDDPAKRLVEKATGVQYGGLVGLDGVECHLLQGSGEELDWQLWIDAGDKPLPRQFMPDLGKAFERLAKANKGKSPFANMKVTNLVTFKDWGINPDFAADAFEFKPPQGAEKIDSLLEALTGKRNEPEPGPHPLLGQPAPEVKLELLDGSKLDLASYQNKKVVILDFWATWCGPCTQAMPIIEKVAEKFKDKGVLLFAVNEEEEAADIKKFLETAELKVAVALDSDGAVGKAYGAMAIPQTVIVGKDGTVQVVRVGLSANLEQQLERDLEALLAGKNLAAEELAAAKAKEEKAAAEKAKSDKAAKTDADAKSKQDAKSDPPAKGK